MAPSEIAERIAAFRAGLGPAPEIPMVERPPLPQTKCRIVCITTDEQGVGTWCPQCPYAA
jgi:hypothetical protein